ncbi:AraC family transcriptional regulator [Amphritea pacifica]|uniref:AraC family transcriptional regulator n=1 Tax=Amphritea pacifica TaxID=2811233 RepID=A0ABS2W425_9GAMM|nr:AraC family transcriptional regulator [Amphritea pacifica]MBN0986454.1 AraC family transcriptional regulator [Amphritea pacifica]MBN1006222.1 AraC family transcriptional regulator [Amphritea pacifica]
MSLKREDPRINRVCDYINQNLDIELSIEQLSGVAALSKYHFHRLFSAFTGVSVVRFIQLMRLKRASFRLAFEHELRIIDIAYEAGFDSPEAFSRAFKRTFGQSPSGFRASPEWPEWHSKFQFDMPSGGELKMNVEIVDFTETPVALAEHKGPREQVLDTVGRFVAWRKETGLSPVKTSRTFGVPYNDPNTTAPEDFRFDVCGSFAGEVPENDYGVKSGVIPAGRCAVVQHRGSHDNIDESIYYLYRNWLPDSGEELRDYPCFFQYRNFIHEVDECDLLTDIFLPLK